MSLREHLHPLWLVAVINRRADWWVGIDRRPNWGSNWRGDKRYLHIRQQGESLNCFNEFLICLVQYFAGVFFVNVYEGFQS